MSKKSATDIISEAISSFVKESDSEREAFVRSLQLAPGDHELSHKELSNFAKRSHGIASSPAQVSAIADINSMNETRLKQVISHPRVHVFMKHRARKRLSKEWE